MQTQRQRECVLIMGPVIVTLGEGESAQAAAGGCSTETSCLHIVLATGWRDKGNFWQGVGGSRQTVHNTEVSLVSVIRGLQHEQTRDG